MEKITKLLRPLILLFFIQFTSTASAQVGIGTTTPSLMLDVQTNTAADGIQINNTRGNGDPILQYQVNGTSRITMGVDDSDSDKFKIGTTEVTTNTRLTIRTNGYIGVGLTNPLYHFHVERNRANNYIANVENTNANGSSLAAEINGTFNAFGAITNNNNGLASYSVHLPNTGLGTGTWGTSNSSDAYGVFGTIPTTGSWLGYGGVFTGGLGYVNGIYNLSDERVKSNITPIDNAISKIKQIKGVSYTYNLEDYNYLVKGDTRTYLGFLAQNVKEIFPEAVAEKQLIVDGPKTMKTTANLKEYTKEIFNVVDYTAIVPVTVEAIKEQQEIIENQNNKITALEDKIAVLENKLNQIIENLD